MSQQRPQDDVQNTLKSGAQKIGNTASRRIQRTARKAVAKTAKKVAAKVAQKGVWAALKGIAAAFIGLLAPILPFVLGAIAVVAGLAMCYAMLVSFKFDMPSWSGAFQTESDNQNNVVITSGTTIQDIQTSLGNDIAGILYLRYATEGYYFTVDDDPDIIQGRADSLVRDFKNRESMFLLSPQMLMALDSGLNESLKIPEQFIKPIYNTCMTSDDSNGYCEMLDLVKDGQVVVKSSKYIKQYFSITDVKPDGIDKDFHGYLYVKTEEKTEGASDWGLAPIFHYTSFTERARVSSYHISTVQVFDPLTGKYTTKNYADLTDSEKKDYPVPVDSFEYGSIEDKLKQLQKPTTKYAIDRVASFLGNIQMDITLDWFAQGSFEQTDYINKVFVLEADEAIINNQDIVKKLCSAGFCVSGTNITKTVSPTGVVSYLVKGNTNPVGTSISNVTSITYEKTVPLGYTKTGLIELYTAKYVNDEPDTSGIVGTKYLEDYIDIYQTYIPLKGNGEVAFACYSTKEMSVWADVDWNSVMTNKDISINEIYEYMSTMSLAEPVRYVANPSECKNDEVAMAVNSKLMTKFFFDEMPNIQYLIIAKLLDYPLTVNEDGELQVGTAFSVIDNIAKPNMSAYWSKKDVITAKYGDIIAKYASRYGVDETLIYSIIMSNNGSDSSGCLSEKGCGVMSVRRSDDSVGAIDAYNYSTSTNDVIVMDEGRLVSDIEYNIQVGVAQLQYLLKKYGNNVLLAIGAYGSSTYEIDGVLAISESEANNLKDVLWTAYLPETTKSFVEIVISNIPSDILKFKVGGAVVESDIRFIRTVSGDTSATAIQNINKYLLSKYFNNKNFNLSAVWNFIFLNQKPYNLQLNDSSAFTELNSFSLSDADKETILKSVFAFAEGKPIESYEDLGQEYWITKVRNLFMNATEDGVKVFYDVPRYIGGSLSNVVPWSSKLIIVREFGFIGTADGGFDVYEDVEYQASEGSKILSITDGTIIDITKPKNGVGATITIAPPAVKTVVDGKEVIQYLTQLQYSNLESIAEGLKIGDKIDSGTVIGKVSSENSNKFNLSYAVNEELADANLILEYMKYVIDANNSSTGSGAVRSNDAWINLLKSKSFENTDFSGTSTWYNPVVATSARMSAGTWSYEVFGRVLAHDAVDIAAPVGSPIKALGDGVILDYYDSTRDYNSTDFPRDPNNWTQINYLLYVMEKDGYVYTVTLKHIKQGSAATTKMLFKEGDVIAMVGDNGPSTGPHLHMSVINHGNQTTVQQVIALYLSKPGNAKFGINPGRNPDERCASSKESFTCGVPVDKIIFK